MKSQGIPNNSYFNLTEICLFIKNKYGYLIKLQQYLVTFLLSVEWCGLE